jgi:hypothetical protein
MIFRGHELQEEGYKYQQQGNWPLALTIFSAPNYGDLYRNKGCIVKIEVLL